MAIRTAMPEWRALCPAQRRASPWAGAHRRPIGAGRPPARPRACVLRGCHKSRSFSPSSLVKLLHVIRASHSPGMMLLAGSSMLHLVPCPSRHGIPRSVSQRAGRWPVTTGTNTPFWPVPANLNQVLSLGQPIAGKVTPVARDSSCAPGCRTLKLRHRFLSHPHAFERFTASFISRCSWFFLPAHLPRAASQASISGRRAPPALMRYSTAATAARTSPRFSGGRYLRP